MMMMVMMMMMMMMIIIQGCQRRSSTCGAALSLSVWARWWNRKRSCNAVMKKDAFALYIVQGVSKKVGPTALNFSSDFWAPAKILLATLF